MISPITESDMSIVEAQGQPSNRLGVTGLLGAGGFRRVGVPGSPVRQQAERPGELGALGGQLVGGPGAAALSRAGQSAALPAPAA